MRERYPEIAHSQMHFCSDARRFGQPMKTTLIPLADLPNGSCGVITTVGGSVAELMDLGFIPGAQVTPAYSSLGGDPRVYRLEGSLVALRRTAACQIEVSIAEKEEEE